MEISIATILKREKLVHISAKQLNRVRHCETKHTDVSNSSELRNCSSRFMTKVTHV